MCKKPCTCSSKMIKEWAKHQYEVDHVPKDSTNRRGKHELACAKTLDQVDKMREVGPQWHPEPIPNSSALCLSGNSALQRSGRVTMGPGSLILGLSLSPAPDTSPVVFRPWRYRLGLRSSANQDRRVGPIGLRTSSLTSHARVREFPKYNHGRLLTPNGRSASPAVRHG